MPTRTIQRNDFLRGTAETDFDSSGALSPIDKGQNLYYRKGLLSPPPTITTKTAIDGIALIVKAENVGLSGNKLALGAVGGNGDGTFYEVSGYGVLTAKGSVDETHVYSSKFSDAVYWNGAFYVTSKTNIAEVTADLATIDIDWWTADRGQSDLDGFTPHQMIVFEGELFIADVNKLYKITTGEVVSTALTLPAEQNIISMVEYQNKIYMYVEDGFNANGNKNSNGKILVFDGVNDHDIIDASYPIRYKRIETLYVYNGSLLAFTKDGLYHWNGISLQFIYKLYRQVFKGQISEYEGRLLFAHGTPSIYDESVQYYIVCWDKRTFSMVHGSTEGISLVFKVATDDIMIGTSTGTEGSFLLGMGGILGTGYFRLAADVFPMNAIIRNVRIRLSQNLASGDTMTFTFFDSKGDEKTIGTFSYSADGAKMFFEKKNINIRTASFQLRGRWNTGKPIVSISYDYDFTRQNIEG